MGKVKYDVTGVESGGRGAPPPPGMYIGKLVECTGPAPSKAGNDQLTCKYEITRGDAKGYPLWDYVGFADNQAWKLRQFLEAMGIVTAKKEKGQMDTGKVIGTEVQIRLKHEMYNDEPQARIASVLPMPEEDDEDEDDLDPDDEAEDDDDEGAGDEYTYEDLAEMDLDDLKGVIKEEELGIRVTAKSKVATVLAKVMAALDIEEPDDDEDDEDDDEEDADYEEWEVSELKDELKERGLKATGAKKALIARLEAHDEEDDPF